MSGLVPVDVAALGVGAFFGALSRYQAGKIAADFIATDPKRFGKLAGWHTAGLNVSGSFLLGVIYAMPAVDTNKINQLQSGVAGKPLDRFQGLTPRAKLMLGVGYVVQLLSLVFVGCLLILLSVNISHNTTFISLSLLDNYFITFSGLTSYEKLLWQLHHI